MKNKIILITCITSFILSGCNSQPLDQVGTNKTGNMDTTISEEITETEEDAEVVESLEIDRTDDIVEVGTTFNAPFVEGNMYYTINQSDIYENLKEAGIKKEDLIFPYNLYASWDIKEQYHEISDYVLEDGSIVDSHQLVLIDITIKNENAMGIIKKNEFLISDISLYGGEPVTQYNIVYFGEAGKVDAEQPLHYELKQGEELRTKIGFFVMKEDAKDLIGKTNDIQFKIY